MLGNGERIFLEGFAEGIAPDLDITVSEWAQEHRRLPREASSYPGAWRNELAPFAVEIMDCLSLSHPCNRVSLMKSAQITGSEIIMNMVGYIIDVSPGPALIVHPTIDAAKSWVQEKLEPNIEENPTIKSKIAESKSRDGKATSTFKSFPGGYLMMTGANSTKGLRQRSAKYLLKDDLDDWPLEVGGQGDPDKMADQRQVSYHASGAYKCFEVSTPTIASISRITKAYEESDQRVYKVPCPQCGGFQELRFFPIDKKPFRGGLHFESKAPHDIYYVCEHKGCIIEHFDKQQMLQGGRWEIQNPSGLHPGFKISAIYSPFTTWEIMVREFLDAKDEPLKLKTFFNLWLGEAWKEKGDAPDYKRLLALRENYALGTIPSGGLIITCGIDVQKDGFYYETVAWGVGKTSWSIDTGFIAGDTLHPETWTKLDILYNQRYRNVYGREFQIDQIGIDANYIPHMVHAWVKRRPRVIATRGVAGPTAPTLGVAARQQVSYSGKKVKGGLYLWPIGTWQAKMEVYGCLRLEGIKEGHERDPFGFCHFSMGHDEEFFKQMTSESLITRERKGRSVTEWAVHGQNHILDCRVINLACATRLQIDRFTVETWTKIAAERDCSLEDLQGDLFLLAQTLSGVPKAGVTNKMEPTNMPSAPASSGKRGRGRRRRNTRR